MKRCTLVVRRTWCRRSKPKLDQCSGIWNDLRLPALIRLQLLHRSHALCVPRASRFPGQVAGFDQRSLNLRSSRFIHRKVRRLGRCGLMSFGTMPLVRGRMSLRRTRGTVRRDLPGPCMSVRRFRRSRRLRLLLRCCGVTRKPGTQSKKKGND